MMDLNALECRIVSNRDISLSRIQGVTNIHICHLIQTSANPKEV